MRRAYQQYALLQTTLIVAPPSKVSPVKYTCVSPGYMTHQALVTSAGQKIELRNPCRASVLTTNWSDVPIFSPVQVIACPVTALTIDGSEIGPVTVMIGLVSKVPELWHVIAEATGGVEPGNPMGRVIGNVRGLITGGGRVAVAVSGTVEYFLGSGATSGMVASMSASVELLNVMFADPFCLTYASFGTGSLYVKVARSETGRLG